ncbi:MmgE/PrpD family protein [Robertmurraya kyonggiensis]|uniref:MmgE/PrpD family protein n=1 Tax=Robertmurraya kyonggiensis TaxID=1037680 RepID=A0A4U1D608_9BACI|nr:MmgE/PrpD family protein [Robertmurraya kyonggiensis]TKC18012.1 MmgE/PrpD family protein [Robertmurraya kyonggiensis]
MASHVRVVPSVTKELSEFTSALKLKDLPRDVIEKTKLCILDALACGLYGSKLPWGELAIQFGQSFGKADEATVFGTNIKIPADLAALVNGTLIQSFEIDDLHKIAVIHPGAEVIPAVLATAEKRILEGEVINGEKVILSVLAGYEVGCRVGVASGALQLKRGFHPSATSGVFGAAAGVAKILDLDKDRTSHSLGIAGTQSAGLMSAQYGAMAKRMNAGRSAQSGVYAGILSQMGFTGITDVLEAEYGGFFTSFADNVRPEDALVNLGCEFEVINVGFKAYACCGSNHTSIDVILELLEQHSGLNAENVNQIIIYTTSTTKKHVGWEYVPSGMTGAQMNLAYAVAVTLTDGECFIDQYHEERIADPTLLNLINKIKIIPVERLDKLGREGRHAIELEVHLKNGSVLRGNRVHARGSSYFPLTDGEVKTKFEKLVKTIFPIDKVEKLKEVILHLEDCSDVRELTKLLQL